MDYRNQRRNYEIQHRDIQTLRTTPTVSFTKSTLDAGMNRMFEQGSTTNAELGVRNTGPKRDDVDRILESEAGSNEAIIYSKEGKHTSCGTDDT